MRYKYEKALARFSVERALYIRYTVLSMLHFTDGGTLASEGGRVVFLRVFERGFGNGLRGNWASEGVAK